MATVQPAQSCDLFAYLNAPGATDAYWNVLDRAAKSISNGVDNCVVSRFHAASALVQIPFELVLTALNGIKGATLNAVFAFLSCDGNKGMEFIKEGLLAVVHAVKLVVALPFLLLGAITAWPREVIEGLAKTDPNKQTRSLPKLEDAIQLSNKVGLMTEQVHRLVATLEPHEVPDNASESDMGSIQEVGRE